MPALELVMEDKKVHFDRKDHITITGEFDKWQHKEHILQYDDQLRVFKVQLPYSGEEELVFKFVLNGTNWTTVDCFEAITDCQGHVNNRVFCKDWLKVEEEGLEEREAQVLSESGMTMDDVSISSAKNGPALRFYVEEVKTEGLQSASEDEKHAGGDVIGELTDATSVDGGKDETRCVGNVGEEYNNQYGSHRSGVVSDSSSCSKVCDLSRDVIPDSAEASEPIQLNADTHTSSKAPLSLPGDYIHVASRGELSSSEDVELSPTVTGEEDLRYSPDTGDNRPRLMGLISAIRMFKTYWRG